MKKSLLGGLLAAVMILVMAGIAAATLIEEDLPSAPAGNGYVTYDTETGLRWLDVNLTVDLSYNQLVANGIIGNGFTIASEYQVASLFQNMNVPSWNYHEISYNVETDPPYLSDILKLGPTELYGQTGIEHGIRLYGFIYGRGSNAAIMIYHGSITTGFGWGYDPGPPVNSNDIVNIEYRNSEHLNPDYHYSGIGWWVVSGENNIPVPSAVPEPSTIFLLSFGIPALVCWCTRIRRRR